MLIAAYFGASGVTDAYFTAYTLILTASDLLLGAALVASCIPVLAPLAQSGPETIRDRQQVIATASLAIIIASGVTACILWIFLPQLIAVMAPGLATGSSEMAQSMGHWMLFLLPVNGLVALFTLALNAHGRFVLAASTVPCVNVIFCVTIVILKPILGPEALLMAALLGPLLTVIVLGVQLRRLGLLRIVRPELGNEQTQLLWQLARPMLLTIGLGSTHGMVLLSHLIVRSYASRLGEGAISALGYAFRIYEVPITLAANTAGALLLPALAALYMRGEHDRIATLWRNAFLWGLIILLPAVVIAAVESHALVDILLRRGNFSARDADLTAEALQGFAPVIFFESCYVVIYRLFYAVRRPYLPIMLSIGIVISLVLLIKTVGGQFGITGLAACLSASFGVVVIAALLTIRWFFGPHTFPPLGRVVVPIGAAALGIALWTFARTHLGTESPPLALLGAIVFGVWYFAAVLLALPEERKALWALAQRKR
jgi:putative peptidoglycan lipid II flippase